MRVKRHRKGERLTVGDSPIPLDQSARFSAYYSKELTLAKGDLIRITKNGKTADGSHRLNNGATYNVQGFDEHGNVMLANGWKIDRDFGHFAYGFVNTSWSSQGKTVDRVFVGKSADSLAASSREQFYVSASRAREQVTVYTDDKESLLSAVSRSDERVTATELTSARDRAEVDRRQERMAILEIPQTATRERREFEYDR